MLKIKKYYINIFLNKIIISTILLKRLEIKTRYYIGAFSRCR